MSFWHRRRKRLETTVEGGTRLEGIYGPEIEIWSVFLYG